MGVEHGKNIAQAIHAKIVTSRGDHTGRFMTHTASYLRTIVFNCVIKEATCVASKRSINHQNL